MEKITITQKDIEEYKIQFSMSGYIVDELAYASVGFQYEDWNSFEYSPREPYMFDYEADLLENMKVWDKAYEIAEAIGELEEFLKVCGSDVDAGDLQVGAYIALNFPESWSEMLEAFTDKLKEDGMDSISKWFNKELQEALDDYEDDCYNEYLYGDQSSSGVIYNIYKKYGYEGDYSKYMYDKKAHSFTFEIPREEIMEAGYRWNQGKAYLLNKIWNDGDNQKQIDKKKSEARKQEYERVKAYKEQRKLDEENARKVKLLSLTK